MINNIIPIAFIILCIGGIRNLIKNESHSYIATAVQHATHPSPHNSHSHTIHNSQHSSHPHSRNISKNHTQHNRISPVRHYQHSSDYADNNYVRAGVNRPYSQRELRHMPYLTGEEALHNMGVPSSEIKNDSLYKITNYHKGQDPSPIHFNPQIHDNITTSLFPNRMINRNIDSKGITHDTLLPDDTRMT